MDNKTVIHVLEGNPNSGKTTTAWLVYLQLLQKGIIEFFHVFSNGDYIIPTKSDEASRDIITHSDSSGIAQPCDFCSIIKIGTSRMGIFSAGDDEKAIINAFEWLQHEKLDFFVVCCRSNGNAKANQALSSCVDNYSVFYHRLYSDYTMANIEQAKISRLPLAENIVETILSNILIHKDDSSDTIRSLRLINLWEKYDIVWNLNRHLNILTGDNGGGKSTLLYTLYLVLQDFADKDNIIQKSDGLEVNLDSGARILTTFLKDKLSTIKEEAARAEEQWIATMLNDLLKKVENKYDSSTLRDVVVETSVNFAFSPEGKRITPNEILSKIRVDLIRTFDSYKLDQVQPSGGKNSQSNQSRSELDSMLDLALVRYAFYIGKLGDQALRIVSEGKSNKDIVNRMQNKDAFLAMLNSYFGETGKSVVAEQGKLQFKLANSQTVIDAFDLSSGEKQLLYTLLTVLLEEQQNYILLLDEPETSLHVSWQRKLIDSIKGLNPNCQIIMATHSPAIIADGYHSFVTNLEDIRIQHE